MSQPLPTDFPSKQKRATSPSTFPWESPAIGISQLLRYSKLRDHELVEDRYVGTSKLKYVPMGVSCNRDNPDFSHWVPIWKLRDHELCRGRYVGTSKLKWIAPISIYFTSRKGAPSTPISPPRTTTIPPCRLRDNDDDLATTCAQNGIWVMLWLQLIAQTGYFLRPLWRVLLTVTLLWQCRLFAPSACHETRKFMKEVLFL